MLILIEIMMLGYSLFGGWIHLKIKSYLWVIRYFTLIMRQRRAVQSMRSVDDKQIMRRMDAKLEFSEVSNPVLKHIVSPVVEGYYRIVS